MTSQVPSDHGYRFPPAIISHAIWLYHRFDLSFRDVEDLLAQRAITVTDETIRQWCQRFGSAYARHLRRAAVRFFRILLKGQGCVPRRLITDKLRSDSAARRTVMPSVVPCTDRYANNRAEVSHQPARQRERQMRGFKAAAHLQRFASVHGWYSTSSGSADTCCGRFTTASCERGPSTNGMR